MTFYERDWPVLEPIRAELVRLKTREEFERDWVEQYGEMSLEEFLEATKFGG